jgi:hypothetical protein
MKRFLVVIAGIVLLAVHFLFGGTPGGVFGSSRDMDAKAALALAVHTVVAKAPAPDLFSDKCDCAHGGKCHCLICPGCSCKDCKCIFGNYQDAYKKAVSSKQTLAVFVAQPALRIPGAVCVRVDKFQDVDGQGVVISRMGGDGKTLYYGSILQGTPSKAVIQGEIKKGKEAPAASQDCPGGV